MSPAEIKDTQAELDRILQANASRPVGTRTLADRSTCTSPRCTCKQGCGR
jgi:hypothetical protein